MLNHFTENQLSRRDFLKLGALGTAALSFNYGLPSFYTLLTMLDNFSIPPQFYTGLKPKNLICVYSPQDPFSTRFPVPGAIGINLDYLSGNSIPRVKNEIVAERNSLVNLPDYDVFNAVNVLLQKKLKVHEVNPYVIKPIFGVSVGV